MTCDRCYQPLGSGDHGLYVCPLQPRRLVAPAVRPDSIPGGLVIEHGPVNDDGSPRRYDSQSELTAACDAKGYRRWTDYYDESKTKDARVRMDWQQSGEAQRLTRENKEREREARR